jgi:hypothetical protein
MMSQLYDPSNMTATVALVVAVVASAALVLLRTLWAISTRRPVAARPHLTGRRATAYWHSPTGLQDERGITARLANQKRHGSTAESASRLSCPDPRSRTGPGTFSAGE